MSKDFERLESIFWEAVAITDADRRAEFLERTTGADEACRKQLELLISAHMSTEATLLDEHSADQIVFANQPDSFEVGAQLGRYRLEQLLGEGGMGAVYKAVQTEPVRRVVALKVLRHFSSNKVVQSRFNFERQTLALMQHPHIAQFREASTTPAGSMYLAMEYLPDCDSITHYCDEKKFSIPQRIELFLQACEAITHAHQKGIIHRDIKPSNLLVTSADDGRPICKVIDFGIAKALNSASVASQHDTLAHEYLGTPEYMSPEQSVFSRNEPDVRSDVYSLGTILFELICGQSPRQHCFDDSMMMDDIHHIIRNFRPPRLVECLPKDAAALESTAKKRSMRPAALRRTLEGDIQWICSKVITHEPRYRYQSIADLANDLIAWQGQGSVSARPPSVTYYLRSYVRRNRKRMLALSVLLGVSLTAAVVSLMFMQKAIDAEQLATDRLRQVKETLEERNSLLAHSQNMEAKALSTAALNEEMAYVSLIRLAGAAYSRGDALECQHLLRKAAQTPRGRSLRGFSWHFLNRTTRPSSRLICKTDAPIYSIAELEDRSILATVGADGLLRVLRRDDGEVLYQVQCDQGELNDVCFSPDDAEIATTGDDGTIRICNVHDGTERLRIRAFDSAAFGVRYSADGTRLVCCGDDIVVRMWNPRTGDHLGDLEGCESRVQAIDVDSTGIVYAACRDGRAVAWNMTTGMLLWRHVLTLGRLTNVVACSRDPGYALFTSTGGEVIALARNGYLCGRHTGTDDLRSVAATKDATLLATGDRNGTVKLFSMRPSLSATAIPLISDTTLPLATWKISDSRIHSLHADNSRMRLTTGSADGSITEAVYADMGSQRIIDVSERALRVAGFSRVNRGDVLIVSRSELESYSGDQRKELPLASSVGNLDHAAIARHEPFIAVASNRTLSAIDCSVAQPSVLWQIEAGGVIHEIALAGGGRLIAVEVTRAEGDHALQLIHGGTGEIMRTIAVEEVQSLALSDDGRYLAYAALNSIHVMDTQTGEPHATIKGHATTVRSLSFSPDSRYLASASADRRVCVWDTSNGDQRFSRVAHSISSGRVHFFPDGLRILSIGDDQVARIWRWKTDQLELELQLGQYPREACISSDGLQVLFRFPQTAKLIIFDARSS